jgi:hypothetical protein
MVVRDRGRRDAHRDASLGVPLAASEHWGWLSDDVACRGLLW